MRNNLPNIILSLMLLVGIPDLSAAGDLGALCGDLPQITYLGGEMDNLALPTDVAHRSEEMNTRFPAGLWKDFDNPAIDRHFGHSFEGLPADITRIELELRAKPGGGGASNDYLHLFTNSVGPSAFFEPFTSLPESGGVWTPGAHPVPVTFLLDLDALPNGSSILDEVASKRRLEIWIQDDTTIDYAKLYVWYYPEETFRVGRMDDYGGEPDTTCRSPELDSVRDALPGTWKDLDDGSSNRGVGHTITGLPSGIVEATFEIRMRAHGDIPDNDSLGLGLNTDPLQFAFSTEISALPEASGSWAVGDGPTVFQLNLDALPGAISLLSKMSSDGQLDVYVQDDSDVDYAKLRLRSCPPRRRAGGLAHRPLGEAELSQTEPRAVTLDGLGVSGNDGVRIELGEAKGWGFTLVDPFDTPNSSRTWTMRGKVDGLLDQPIFTERHDVLEGEGGSTRVQVFHDQSATGASQFQVDFFAEDGTLLHETTLDNGLAYEFDYTAGPPPPFVIQWDGTCVVRPIPPLLALSAGDGATVNNVAKIELRALDATKSVEFCSAVESTGTNLATAHLTDEVHFLYSCPHWSAGGASLEAFSGLLTVGNLGIDGRDGITFGLGGADSVLIDLLPVDPGDEALVGSFLRVGATGELGGSPDQDLGSLVITKTATEVFEYRTDFSNLSTNQQRVQVFSAGTLVSEQVVPVGVAIQSNVWPRGLGKLGGGLECFVGNFPSGTVFTNLGALEGVEIVGDQLRLLAEGGQAVAGKSTFTLRGAGMGELTIENATLDPVLTPGLLFADGFESGDTSRWTGVAPVQ